MSTRRAHDRPGRCAHRQLEDPETVRRQVGGLHVDDREARGGAGRGCRPGRRRARRGTGGSWCDVAAPGGAGRRWRQPDLWLALGPAEPVEEAHASPSVITWTGELAIRESRNGVVRPEQLPTRPTGPSGPMGALPARSPSSTVPALDCEPPERGIGRPAVAPRPSGDVPPAPAHAPPVRALGEERHLA